MRSAAPLIAPAAPSITGAYAIGVAHEATLDQRDRRLGAHYTPVDIAEGLVARVFELIGAAVGPELRCWDPSCGGGVFLVALAEQLARRGVPPEVVLEQCVVGVDSDPGAVAASRAALAEWGRARGVESPRPVVLEADGLGVELGTFDVVAGNPPFRSQLGADTARDDETVAARKGRFGAAAQGYVDDAVLFLLAATASLRPGGVACLVQPRSTLATTHAAPARATLLGRCALAAAWFPGTQVFAADVDVWAPFLVARRSGDAGVATTVDPVRIFDGRGAQAEGAAQPGVAGADWARLAAHRAGVPEIGDLRAQAGRLGDRAEATAGFRDEYYAVLAHTSDERPNGVALRVVTSGMIDPAACYWGAAPARFGKQRWAHPWLDVEALCAADARVGRWVTRLAVPKVLVAAQTQVVEAVADRAGDLVPVTPTIAVVPHDPGDLDLMVAALVSPPVAAWAQRRRAGSGMSATAVRLSAKDIAEVPLPAHADRWRCGAGLVAAGARWREIGAVMCEAYGIDGDAGNELRDWWEDRLPRRARRSQADPD